MVMKNPFVTNSYAGPEYFSDRVENIISRRQAL